MSRERLTALVAIAALLWALVTAYNALPDQQGWIVFGAMFGLRLARR